MQLINSFSLTINIEGCTTIAAYRLKKLELRLIRIIAIPTILIHEIQFSSADRQ